MNRKIDIMGRIVLPKEMRDKLGFKDGDKATITLEGDRIVIRNDKKMNKLEDRKEKTINYIQALIDKKEMISSESLIKAIDILNGKVGAELTELLDILEGKDD